jgi:predicted AAA+ superfamily ATPase
MDRAQLASILKDLERKMVFLTGPRQVGKTWLSREIGRRFEHTTYLNYDAFDDRAIIESGSWYSRTDLLILDELHKMRGWKSFVKGVFDTRPPGMRILVTGSARLDMLRRSGDSLSGRYFLHRLMPFSLAELKGTSLDGDLDRLLERGGFPEPLLADDPVDADRWRTQYKDSLVRTDVLDFGRVAEIKNMELVFELLRRRTGSLLSYNSIAEDVKISPPTAKSYVDILEQLFIIFRVTPYATNIARAIHKRPKVYFFDNGLVVGDEGARLENAVAVSLLKSALARTDETGREHSLRYLRTKEGKEVDFCVCRDESPLGIFEIKLTETKVSPALRYFHGKYGIAATQVVHRLSTERTVDGIDVRSATSFLQEQYR